MMIRRWPEPFSSMYLLSMVELSQTFFQNSSQENPMPEIIGIDPIYVAVSG